MNDEERKDVKDLIGALIEDDGAVRKDFHSAFKDDILSFVDIMCEAFEQFKEFDSRLEGNVDLAHVSSLVFATIKLHITSMTLFTSGHFIPAGNTQRQVLETISLALLCSKPKLGYLYKFAQNKFSTNKAIAVVKKNAQELGVNKKAFFFLQKRRDFYHQFSHPSNMTIADCITFGEGNKTNLGPTFDKGKMIPYRKEMESRLAIAKLLVDLIKRIRKNLKK